MEKRKCIVVAVSSLAGGGAERVAIDFANEFRMSGLEVVLLVGSIEGRYLEIIASHVTLISVDVPLAICKSFRFASQLNEVLAGWAPVIVISHLTEMNRMLLRCKMLGALTAPVIAVDHNSMALKVGEGLRGRLLKFELRMLYARAHRIVGVSKGVLESVREITGVPQGRCSVINNSIDVSALQEAASSEPDDAFAEVIKGLPRPLVISVGRLNWQKAFDLLIEAFCDLPESSRGSLIILGEGEKEQELKELVRLLGMEDRIHFPGFVKNPWWYMAQSDLFVSSSVWEGFGLVLAEAMACGVPVVSTDSPGPAEVIEHGASGLLVEPGNRAALCAAMCRCLDDEDLRNVLRTGGLQRVGRFLPETTHSKYINLIEEVLSSAEDA